jgi:hypothetical protein
MERRRQVIGWQGLLRQYVQAQANKKGPKQADFGFSSHVKYLWLKYKTF